MNFIQFNLFEFKIRPITSPNLEFKNIELNKVDDVKKEIESKKDNLKNNFSDDDVKKIFLDSLNNWRKKNLKNLTENIYQELIKETLKDKLK